LRDTAISYLAGNNGNPELWQIYQTETTTEGKLQLLRYMYANATRQALEVVRTEKTQGARRSHACAGLAAVRASADTLVSLYSAEPTSKSK